MVVCHLHSGLAIFIGNLDDVIILARFWHPVLSDNDVTMGKWVGVKIFFVIIQWLDKF